MSRRLPGVRDKEIALVRAAQRGDIRTMEALALDGISLTVTDGSFWEGTPLHRAAKDNQAASVEWLLARGVSVEATAWADRTALFWAVEVSALRAMEVLVSHGARLHVRDRENNTLMHWAAIFGQKDAILWLLSKGVGFEEQNSDLLTPAGAVAVEGDVGTVTFLVERGSSLTARGKNGRTLLHELAERPSCLHVLQYVFEKEPALLHEVDHSGATALHQAALMGSHQVIPLLVEAGADMHALNKNFNSAAEICLAFPHRCAQETLRALLDCGASFNPHVRTPMELWWLPELVESCSAGWRDSRHTLFPRPFRRAVFTFMCLWTWNHDLDTPWHPEGSVFILSLELVFLIFEELGRNVFFDGWRQVGGSQPTIVVAS